MPLAFCLLWVLLPLPLNHYLPRLISTSYHGLESDPGAGKPAMVACTRVGRGVGRSLSVSWVTSPRFQTIWGFFFFNLIFRICLGLIQTHGKTPSFSLPISTFSRMKSPGYLANCKHQRQIQRRSLGCGWWAAPAEMRGPSTECGECRVLVSVLSCSLHFPAPWLYWRFSVVLTWHILSWLFYFLNFTPT